MTDAEVLDAAYQSQLAPDHPMAARIWADLARVCHAGETTHVPGDPTASAFREGKRAVFLYIAGRLSIPLTPSP